MTPGDTDPGGLSVAWVGEESFRSDFRQEWELLVERDPDASVFQTLDWIEPWWRCVGEGRLRVLTVRRHGLLVAAAALVERIERYAGMRARVLAFAGDPLADRLGVLGDAEETAAVGAAVQEILSAARGVDVVRLAEIAEGSATDRALQASMQGASTRAVHRRCASAPVRPLADPLSKIEGSYSRALRQRLRRARAKHSRAGGMDFRRWTPRTDEVPALIEEFAQVENCSWKGAQGVGIFSTSERRKFFEAVSSRMADRGWLDVATLRKDGRLAAYRYGFRFRGVFLDYNLAHDPAFDSLSPGRVLLDEIVRDSHAIGLRAVDASRGSLDRPHMLAEWTSERRLHRRWLLFGTSWRAASLRLLEARLKPALRRARGAVRRRTGRSAGSQPAGISPPPAGPPGGQRGGLPAPEPSESVPSASVWSAVLLMVRAAVIVVALGLGLAIATGSSMLAAVLVAAPAGLVLGLYAPVVALLGVLLTGPTLGQWLDVVIAGLPAVTVDRCLLLVTLMAVAARWRRTNARLPLGPIPWCMAAFLAVAAISALAGGGTRRSNLEGGLRNDLIFLILGYGIPFACFVLARTLLYRPSHLRWMLRILVAVGVVVALTGILQFFFGVTLFIPTRVNVIHTDRATGTLTSAVEFGLVVGTGLITAVVLLIGGGPLWRRGLLLACIAVMVVACFASRTRAPWLGIAAGLAVVAYYEPRLRRPLAVVGAAAAAAGAVVWPMIADTEFVSGRVLDLTPLYNRISLTATALNMFIHHPFRGLGFGRFTFDLEKWQYLISFGDVSPYYAYSLSVPHNELLHVLVLVGLIGFVPYTAIYILGWRGSARYGRATVATPGPGRDVTLVCLGMLVMYFVGAAFSDVMFYFHASTQVLAVMGVVDGLRVRRLVAGGGGAG